jgi:hypothetical protein
VTKEDNPAASLFLLGTAPVCFFLFLGGKSDMPLPNAKVKYMSAIQPWLDHCKSASDSAMIGKIIYFKNDLY